MTLVPNPDYSSSPKPTISKLVELPFTSETAIYNEIRSGGPSALTIANLPAQYAPQISSLEGQGYVDNKAASYSFNYFPLNLNNPKVGPIFRQPYFRQAFQHLVDQPGWIHAFLHDTANPTYGPIPLSPPSPLVNTAPLAKNPYPFSVQAAKQLLTQSRVEGRAGWDDHLPKPDRSCGAGIKAGEGISFNLDYQSGVVAVQNEMNDLDAQAKKVGINIDLTTHPFATVIGTAIGVQAEPARYASGRRRTGGRGGSTGLTYLPTGEPLYFPGAVANYGSYSDPQATKLIDATIIGPAAQETQALTDYDKYMEQSGAGGVRTHVDRHLPR